ncbi:MAG: hypothetical protein U0168_24640 [Nannocystaceae bacterium]
MMCRRTVDAIEPVHPFAWPSNPNGVVDPSGSTRGSTSAPRAWTTASVVLAVHHVAIQNGDVSLRVPAGAATSTPRRRSPITTA